MRNVIVVDAEVVEAYIAEATTVEAVIQEAVIGEVVYAGAGIEEMPVVETKVESGTPWYLKIISIAIVILLADWLLDS